MGYLSRLVAILSCVVSLSAVAATSSPMADLFGQLPMYKSVQISFDGKRIAYLQKLDSKHVLVNRSLETEDKPKVYSLAEGVIDDFSWVSNDRILVEMRIPYYSKGYKELFVILRTGIYNVHTNEMIWPFGERQFINFFYGPSLVHRAPSDPDHIVMEALSTSVSELTVGSHVDGESSDKWRGLYRVNIETGDAEELDVSMNTGTRWLVNSAGEIVMKYRYNGALKHWVWLYWSAVDEEYVHVTKGEDGDGEVIYFSDKVLGADTNLAHIFYVIRDDDKDGLDRVVRATIDRGELVEHRTVTRSDLYDVNTTVTDSVTGAVVGTVHVEDYDSYRYIDRDYAQVQANLNATFPGATVRIASRTSDFTKVIAMVSSHAAPETYYLYDRSAESIAEVANALPGITPELLSPVERFDYTARDGLLIHAYLTLPSGASDDRPVPLVLLPHGGPSGRDNMAYNWKRQFLAASGYAVFQPNFRGSTGYGSEFEKAGSGEWGGKMQQDLDDGVKALVEAGLVDPERVCAIGASYGGYAALIATITRPKLYRCAVAFAPVTNLAGMYKHVQTQYDSAARWENTFGSRFEEERLKARSPAYLVTQDTPPILLFHGDKDTVVPYGQSYQLWRNLRKAGNPHARFETLDDEDHWLSMERSRQTFLRQAGEFLEQHIGG